MQLFDILWRNDVAVEYEQIVSAICCHKNKQRVGWNGMQTVAADKCDHQFQKTSLNFKLKYSVEM
jgi:hypothetical protein